MFRANIQRYDGVQSEIADRVMNIVMRQNSMKINQVDRHGNSDGGLAKNSDKRLDFQNHGLCLFPCPPHSLTYLRLPEHCLHTPYDKAPLHLPHVTFSWLVCHHPYSMPNEVKLARLI